MCLWVSMLFVSVLQWSPTQHPATAALLSHPAVRHVWAQTKSPVGFLSSQEGVLLSGLTVSSVHRGPLAHQRRRHTRTSGCVHSGLDCDTGVDYLYSIYRKIAVNSIYRILFMEICIILFIESCYKDGYQLLSTAVNNAIIFLLPMTIAFWMPWCFLLGCWMRGQVYRFDVAVVLVCDWNGVELKCSHGW